MRKLKFLNPQIVDVLILDDEGNRHIKPCIPEIASFSILPVRGVIPLIANFKFIFRVLIHIFKFKKIKDAILFSIVDVLQPKILITQIDSTNLMGRIHAEFPDKLTISVQNGFRSGPKYRTNSYSRLPVSLFYCFGEHDELKMKSMGIKHKEYVAAGSLVYGLYKKKCREDIKNKYDVCFISQLNFDARDDSRIASLNEHIDSIFSSLITACKELNLSLAVGMRNETTSLSYSSEFNHLSAIDTEGFAKIIPNNFGTSEGYNVSTQSNILVSVQSTLGFEMFGAGNKVLFGASINNFTHAHYWDAFDNFNKLPRMNQLDDFSVNSMLSKLNFLIDIDINEYLEQTANTRKYYMNHCDKLSTHELIKNKMLEFLSIA